MGARYAGRLVLALGGFALGGFGQTFELGDEIELSRVLSEPPLNLYQCDLRCDPGNPDVMLVSAKNGLEEHTVAFLTRDGGATWSATRQPASGDPDCIFDENGGAHWSFMDKPTQGRLGHRRLLPGMTEWTEPKVITEERTDKPHLAVDRTGGRFHNSIYLIGRQFDKNVVVVARSRDGGSSWQTALAQIGPHVGQGFVDGPPQVLPDGALVVFVRSEGRTEVDASGRWQASQATVYVIASADGGVTFSEPYPIRTLRRRLGDGPGSARGTAAAAGVWNGGARLYFAAVVPRFRAPAVLEVQTSDDAGRSWSAPRAILPPDADGWGAGPLSVVANSKGVVGIQFFRMAPSGKRFDFNFTASTDGGASFSAPVRVSSASSIEPVFGRQQARELGGDQIFADAASDGSFRLIWTDHRHGDGNYRLFYRKVTVRSLP